MTPRQALEFVQHHGVVLASAKGPAPRLTDAIVGEPIEGSWWAHPESQRIFAILQALGRSDDILVCRLVNGKVTFVHRRLWPALVRAAARFSERQLAQVHESHTAAGHHVSHDVAFPEWVPAETMKRARLLDEQEALEALGPWATHPDRSSKSRRRTLRR